MLIKYKNTYILTILAPKFDFLQPYPGCELQKIIIFFTFPIVSYILCCLMVILWWIGRIYRGEILIKYQNTYILMILAPKCDFLPPYPGHELQKIIILFYFSISSLHNVLPKGHFLLVWEYLLGENFDKIPKYLYFDDFGPKM